MHGDSMTKARSILFGSAIANDFAIQNHFSWQGYIHLTKRGMHNPEEMFPGC